MPLDALLEFGVRDSVFVAPLRNHGQIIKVFEQSLVFLNRQDNRLFPTLLVRQILNV